MPKASKSYAASTDRHYEVPSCWSLYFSEMRGIPYCERSIRRMPSRVQKFRSKIPFAIYPVGDVTFVVNVYFNHKWYKNITAYKLYCKHPISISFYQFVDVRQTSVSKIIYLRAAKKEQLCFFRTSMRAEKESQE